MSATATRTTCPYCGVGCGLVATVEDGRLASVAGDPLHPVNRGATCRKPLALPDAVHAPDRATTPLLRGSLDERWRAIGWDDAIATLAGALSDTLERDGPDAIALYLSGQLLTEDYYAAGKLAKGFLGTNNVDSNSRLCMSSAVAGYREAFGSDGPPASYEDLTFADHLLVLGSNTAACHPVVWAAIRRRQAEGATVTVIDPRRTETAQAADLHLPVRPGADLPLLSALLHQLAAEGCLDEAFLERSTEGADAALAAAAEWPPERAAAACGVETGLIVEAARRFGGAKRAMVLWSMGANQSTVGTLKNRALINLCLATGNVGRPGTGPLSLTGQPNAMGGRESGGLAQLLPGYRDVGVAEHRAEMRRLWGIPPELAGISARPGLPATELTEALEAGRVKVVWIVATNPAVSLPEPARFAAALGNADLVVVQDAYHPTETGALAHLVLPAAQWPEKDGTMTNSERRVSLVSRALRPPGEARADWEVFAAVGRALGHADAFAWPDAAAVHVEYAQTTAGRLCDQTGVSHARLRRDGPLQWPVPAQGPEGEDHPGTRRLYRSGRFPAAGGRARLAPTPHAEPADAPDAAHPLVLTTGRIAHQWHTMTRTGKSPELLGAEPEPYVELHPDDARAAGVRDGERVRVCSRRGETVLRARVREALPPGVAFAPFHWGALHLQPGETPVNGLIGTALDPTSRQAELKACAVRVESLARRRATTRAPRPRSRLLVVGTGMAAAATVEGLLAHDEGDGWAVTMAGREPGVPYDRIALSRLLAGDLAEHEIVPRDAQWWGSRNVEVLGGAGVGTLDLDGRVATLEDGREVAFDRVVLATGSQPMLPPIDGLARAGVYVFRTLADARSLIGAAGPGRRAIVVGGGLLGLEAARGLRARGAHVTVVHLAPHLMETQLDPLAAGLLERAMRALGVEVLTARRTTSVAGNGRAEAVVLHDGHELATDLVVVATGVRPEVELARAAGLEVGRGVLVDDELRASAPGTWAVGECSEHRGVLYGLWAPLLQQARAAAASIAGVPTAFLGAVPATTLKVVGVDLFCGGRPAAAGPDEEELLSLDTRRGRYRKLVLRDGRLVGAVLLGDLADARRLRELLSSGARVPDALLEPEAGGSAPPPAEPGDVICSCNVVTRGEIESAVAERGLATTAQVAERTRASTGCGGCRPEVDAIVASARQRRERDAIAELRAVKG